jgi:EAL domain-containing protein (putative c-di-GMP-specific phosphodiesterase class I)
MSLSTSSTPSPEGVSDPPHVAPVGHLHHPALSGFPLTTLADGRVVGEFYQARLASVFQPIVNSRDGQAIGHHGYLRVASANGESLTPYSVFAQAADDTTLVKLDRLTRSLHAVNYFHQAPPLSKLFLNVEQRLLTTVANEHGLVFESILSELSVKPERVVISLPNAALSNPALLVRSILSYRNRGYGVMVHVNGFSDPGLGRLFLAEPHYVQIDVPAPGNAALAEKLLKTLHSAGFVIVARKIETPEQAALARELGFDLLHGFHFGHPRTSIAEVSQ